MSYDYFDELVHSVPTSRVLLQKAHETGALIEGLCLYVSLLDALLRLGIIYTRTQKAPDHTYQVAKQMIRQEDNEKTYSEKEIYRQALSDGVIAPELHDKLLKMYAFRNKVVHRFNISNITYAEIGEACTEFEKIYQEVMVIIDVLENGPHEPRQQTAAERKASIEKLFKKIGPGGDRQEV
jgi:uncharacterized protein YutE (UPF0331/DUF86 family)